MKFESVKNKIICELVNYEENKELLEQIPYVAYHDVAIIFRVLCTLKHQEVGTILITHTHTADWENVTEQDLLEEALPNTIDILGKKVCEISQIIKGHDIDIEAASSKMRKNRIPMYVMSNKHGYKGATVLLATEFLEQFAKEHNTDFYILPSSVHELILLPAATIESVSMLKDMVVQINQTEVSKEDKLSDHIYYYALGSNKVSLVA